VKGGGGGCISMRERAVRNKLFAHSRVLIFYQASALAACQVPHTPTNHGPPLYVFFFTSTLILLLYLALSGDEKSNRFALGGSSFGNLWPSFIKKMNFSAERAFFVSERTR
jgi:hypothetical protein